MMRRQLPWLVMFSAIIAGLAFAITNMALYYPVKVPIPRESVYCTMGHVLSLVVAVFCLGYLQGAGRLFPTRGLPPSAGAGETL